MNRLTDNRDEVGKHVFERAGLGKPPYTMIGFHEMKFQAAPGASIVPGGSCDYCGTGIMYACELRSSDGKQFHVGCDCVIKSGDAGLIRLYKTHPTVRATNREKAKAKDAKVITEWKSLISDEIVREKLNAIKIPAYRGGTESWLTFAERAWEYCGASGRARYLRTAKRILINGGLS